MAALEGCSIKDSPASSPFHSHTASWTPRTGQGRLGGPSQLLGAGWLLVTLRGPRPSARSGLHRHSQGVTQLMTGAAREPPRRPRRVRPTPHLSAGHRWRVQRRLHRAGNRYPRKGHLLRLQAKTQRMKQGRTSHSDAQPWGASPLPQRRKSCSLQLWSLSIQRERLTANGWGGGRAPWQWRRAFWEAHPCRWCSRLVGRGWMLAASSCSSKGERFGDLARGRRRSHTTEKQTVNSRRQGHLDLIPSLSLHIVYPEYWTAGRMDGWKLGLW